MVTQKTRERGALEVGGPSLCQPRRQPAGFDFVTMQCGGALAAVYSLGPEPVQPNMRRLRL